ncbi:hypothetical protein ACIBCN_41965 [Nocardia sp. NPDC051052]|uniref:hypothetical protein n=1 Tax=Nocardia sp. NPDC051052 TaxID=3364322 RepID=UPI003795C479
MFHRSATAAVTGLLAVAATLAVATGAANAAPTPQAPGSKPSETAPAEQNDLFGLFAPEGGKKPGDKGAESKQGNGKGGKAEGETPAADPEVAAALDSALRDFLRPPHGGAEMGPLGKTSDEWLDLFLGPKPSPGGGAPKAKPLG